MKHILLAKQVCTYGALGLVASPFVDFFKTYIFSDFNFLKFLTVVVVVDTLLGIVKAVKNKQFSSAGYGMVVTKFIVYCSAMIVSHVITSFTVHGQNYIVFSWFDSVVFSSIILREAISVFENIAIIYPNLFPRSLLKYLKDFDSFTGHKKLEDEKK